MEQVHFTYGRLINVTDRMEVRGDYGWEPKTNSSKGVFHSMGVNNGETVAIVEIYRGERLSLEYFTLNDIWIDNKEGK